MTIEIARVTTLEEMAQGIRRRRKSLGLSQSVVDHIAGMAGGHTAKIECGDKGLGKISVPLLLGALKLEIVLMPATSQHRGRNGHKSEDFFTRRARQARAAQLAKQTPKQRRKIAKVAAKARWKAERERKANHSAPSVKASS